MAGLKGYFRHRGESLERYEMKIDSEKIIERVNYLIKLEPHENAKRDIEYKIASEMESGTISLLENLYGANSKKCSSFLESLRVDPNKYNIVGLCLGNLKSIKSEIEAGLIGNIKSEFQGEVFGDFILLARKTLEEGNKDVAAVLACAALEDTLKQYADQNDIDVDDKDMSKVISALKGEGLLKGPQAKIASGYVTLRNKAFHAEWDKIGEPEVASAIGFTEQFLLNNFS